MQEICILLVTIADLRAAAVHAEVDVRLKKLEREIETELLESQDAHHWANC